MNAQELDIHDALHEAMNEVIVTDHDVLRIEEDMVALLEAGTRITFSRPRWRVALAAAVVLAVVATGAAVRQGDREPPRPAGAPIQEQPLVTQEQPLVPPWLVGLWRAEGNSQWLWEFRADGRSGLTNSAGGYIAGDTVKDRITRRVGDHFTFMDEPPVAGCDGTNSIRLVAPGVVLFTDLTDACQPDPDTLPLQRVFPGPAGPQAGEPNGPPIAPFVVKTIARVGGTWLHVESGTLMSVGLKPVSSSLTYVIDDDGDGSTDPDQRGLISMNTDGSVQVRPFAQDIPGCAPLFAKVMSDNATLTTTSAAGGCFPAASQQTWIRLH